MPNCLSIKINFIKAMVSDILLITQFLLMMLLFHKSSENSTEIYVSGKQQTLHSWEMLQVIAVILFTSRCYL